MKNAMLLLTLIATGVVVVTGCGKEGGSPQPATAPVTITLVLPAGATQAAKAKASAPTLPSVASIELEVKDSGGTLVLVTPSNPYLLNVTPGQLIAISLQVAAGNNLTFKATGYSAQSKTGTKLYSGQVTTNIETGLPKVIALQMSLVSPLFVQVLPEAAQLFPARTLQFTASVLGSLLSTDSTSVTWTVSGGGTINATTGLYTAPSALPSTNPVTVTATSAANTSITGSATVKVVRTERLPIIGFPTFFTFGTTTLTPTLALSPNGQSVVFVDCCPNRLIEVNLLTSVVRPVTSALKNPAGVVLLPDGLTAIVTEPIEAFAGVSQVVAGARLLSVTLSTGAATLITERLQGPGPVILESSGAVWVGEKPGLNQTFGRLSKVNLATGGINPISLALAPPTGLVSDAFNSQSALVTETIPTGGFLPPVSTLARVDLVSGVTTRLATTGATFKEYMAVAPFDAATALVTEKFTFGGTGSDSEKLVSVIFATGEFKEMTGFSGLGQALGLLRESGTVYLATSASCGGKVVRVNAATKAVTILARGTPGMSTSTSNTWVLQPGGTKAWILEKKSSSGAMGPPCPRQTLSELDLTTGVLQSLTSPATLNVEPLALGVIGTTLKSAIIASGTSSGGSLGSIIEVNLSDFTTTLLASTNNAGQFGDLGTIIAAVLDSIQSPPRMLVIDNYQYGSCCLTRPRLVSIRVTGCFFPNCTLTSLNENFGGPSNPRLAVTPAYPGVLFLTSQSCTAGCRTDLYSIQTSGCTLTCPKTLVKSDLGNSVIDFAVEPGGASALFINQGFPTATLSRLTFSGGAVTTVHTFDADFTAQLLLLEPGGAVLVVDSGSRFFRVYIGP